MNARSCAIWELVSLLVTVFSNVHCDSIQIIFLITVNDTWNPSGCIYTAITPPLRSGVKYNKSDSIRIGDCDEGPLRFNFRHLSSSSSSSSSSMAVDLTFFSSVIVDASPPGCSIEWNGTYLTPKTQAPGESLLPGCFVMDSREGYHMTYYWFHLLEWMFL